MTTDADLARFQETFMEEARELIAQMEAILLRSEDADCAGEELNALFRCAHTIKGSAGLFGLDEVVRFAHVVENVLDRLRNGTIRFEPALANVLLVCSDHFSNLLAAADAQTIARSDELIATLAPWAGGGAEQPSAEGGSGHPPSAGCVAGTAEPQLQTSGGGPLGADHWHVSLRFEPSVFASGNDPLITIDYLSHCGRIVHVETVTAALPDFDEADAEHCYLGFEVALQSEAGKAEIENVFEFISMYARIVILPPGSRIEEYRQLIESLPDERLRLGEILVACGTLTQKELDQALAEQGASDSPPRLGDILVDRGAVQPQLIAAAADKQRRNEAQRALETQYVKVPAGRLDALIDRVGELVIAGAGSHALAKKTAAPELQESAAVLLSLVEDIRDMALALRMVAIGEVFARFPRVVRDVARELGKDIELTISGAEAELDKSMIEKIADPLMHLVRNAIDHGIEPAGVREAAGKCARGNVRLHAYHESGIIVIEVADDGSGLDAEKIRAKAIERGLIGPADKLDEDDLFRLILVPGFSTAAQVSELSGRGVGMDVVKSNVEALRGTLDIRSQAGRGTTMRLCLPLTLAIIDGLHVGIGSSHFVVPLDLVLECIELPAGTEHVDYIELRGEALPFIRLRRLFDETGPAHLRPRVIIVRFAGRRVGLVVDRVHGKCQTVIKPLGPLFKEVPCVSGSTILGDGEVALILDVARLVGDVAAHARRAARTGANRAQPALPAAGAAT